MRLCSRTTAVLLPQRLLNLAENRSPLRTRLPLPEKDKSLAANAAMQFCVAVRALAKYLLHSSSSVPDGFFHPAGHDIECKSTMNMPHQGRKGDFVATR
jgi:hypothetical protein